MSDSWTLKELRLRNFRGFESARLDLSDLTILVGPNGAGKSTLLEGLEFLREAVSDSLRTALERRGGLGQLRRRRVGPGKPFDLEIAMIFAQADLHLLYGLRLGAQGSDRGYRVREEVLFSNCNFDWFLRNGDEFHSSVPGLQPTLDSESLLLPIIASQAETWGWVEDMLRGLRTYAFSSDQLRLEPFVGRAEALLRNGANLGDVLQGIWALKNHKKKWVSEYLAAIVPDLVGLEPSSAAGRRLIRFQQASGAGGKPHSFEASSMSVGTLKSLALLAALAQNPTPTLVAVEDIEDSIHPAALGVIMQAVETYVGLYPIVLTTHSPELLNFPAVQPERIRLIGRQAGVSQISDLAPELLSLPPYESVGSLLRVNGLFPASSPSLCEACLEL